MAHVLIGFAEALPAPEVVFSLKSAGHRVSAFARKGADHPLRGIVADWHPITAPEEDARLAVEDLRRLMTGSGAPDLILPLDDGGLWLVDAALGGDPRVVGETGDKAAVALDKMRQIEAARAAGLAVLPTAIVASADELSQAPTGPAIAKPRFAIRTRDGRLGKPSARYLLTAQDRDALARAMDDGPFLVQPLVHGTGEGLFGIMRHGRAEAWSGHRRLRMMNPHGSGSSACQSLVPDPDLRARCERFLQAIGWNGPFMVELLRDSEGTAWFMELNGRPWGSMALARRQGLEYPAWSVAAALDATFVLPVPPPPARALTVRHLGRDLLHLLFVLKGPRTDFHRQGWPRFLPALMAVLRPNRLRHFYNHDPGHPGYMLKDTITTVRKALSHARD